MPLVFLPARFVPVMPAVMHVDRVVPGVDPLDFKPREDADAEIGVIVVIAEVVVAVTRIGEQVSCSTPMSMTMLGE